MHPFLKRARFGLYLLCWVPLSAILVYVLGAGGPVTWTESTALVLPLCAIYMFVCLGAWYPVKGAPLSNTPVSRLVLTHILAATLLSLLWIQLARGLAFALSRTTSLADTPAHLASRLPILFGAGFVLYLLTVAYNYVLFSMEAAREAEARVLESNILARDAELKALKAQINPHFLFNSLNSISALTSIDAGRARDMCVLLGEFLRMTLGLGEKTVVRFSEELDLLQKYLTIEKIRFGERLKTQETIQEESKACLLPPLLLQPLMENAIRHGIASLPGGGEVRLTAERQNGRLEILVENSWDPDAPPRRSSGLGLRNVRQRLEARYGKEAALRVMTEGELFQVSLSIPVESEERA